MPRTNGGFVITKDTLTPGLKKFGATLPGAITIYLKAQETKVQDYMRNNASWTDRTGNARNGLFANYSGSAVRHEIRLSHSISYGIWLEVRFSGQYAIIVPTLQAEGIRIMTGLNKLINKMTGNSVLTAGGPTTGGGISI